MTDIWCFTCNHEIRPELAGGYSHLDRDDLEGCPCTDDEEACQP
jgi:hypothetical protein